jgi:hypothetical protein
MEKAIRKGSGAQSSSTTSQNPLSLESIFGLPEDLNVFLPSDEVIVNLVGVYFQLLQDSFFNFLHKETFTSRMQEQTLPKSLLYAVCATSARSHLKLLGLIPDIKTLSLETLLHCSLLIRQQTP